MYNRNNKSKKLEDIKFMGKLKKIIVLGLLAFAQTVMSATITETNTYNYSGTLLSSNLNASTVSVTGRITVPNPVGTNDAVTLQYINGRFPSISTAQVSVAQVNDTNNFSRWYKSQSGNDAYWANKVVVPTVTSYGLGVGGGSNAFTYIIPNGYTSFTMCCWFNPTSNPPSTVGGILTARGSGYMTMRQSFTNHLRVDINNAQSIYSNAFPTTGQWYHIAVTWDNASTNIDVFVNGIKNTSQVNGAGGTMVNNTSLVVGWDNFDPSWYVNAKIDEICMWTRKLTDAEIADVANQRYVQTSATYPSTGRSMGLNILQILHLDSNTGTSLTDSSGLANNGGLNTASWTGGKALSAGVTESTIISSSDGQLVSENGIHTFGNQSGRTVLDGVSTRFNISGAEQMRLDSGALTPTVNGILNIGSPTYAFGSVYSSGTISGQTVNAANVITTNYSLPLSLPKLGGGSNWWVDSSGQMGIGSNTPTARLYVTGRGSVGAHMWVNQEAPAAGANAGTLFSITNVIYGRFGISGANDSLITGDVLGDFGVRVVSKRILFSTDNGNTASVIINTNGSVVFNNDIAVGGLSVSNAVNQTLRTVTVTNGTYTASITNDYIRASDNVIITLPSATASGKRMYIKNFGNGTVTINNTTTNLIDGQINQLMSPKSAITVIDGAVGMWDIL